jgi:hypothetical protein
MVLHEEPDGWLPDPLGRYDERFFVYGEASRLVRTAGIEAADPLGVEPTPQDAHPGPLAAVSFVTFEETPTRSTRVVWAVLAALCAVCALVFVNLPVSLRATTRDGSRSATLHCGSVFSPESNASVAGFPGVASTCGSRREPLAGIALALGVLAAFALFRSITADEEAHRRSLARARVDGLVIDLDDPVVEGSHAPDADGRSIVLA